MKTIKYLIVLILFFSCSKDNAFEHEVEGQDIKYSITGVMTMDSVEVSKIKINYKLSGLIEESENDGLFLVDFLGNGEELWFHFTANKGDLYKVSWQDSWWEQYTAGSIYVTAYEEDKSTEYFSEDRLIQMTGSPKVMSVGKNGIVYIKVRGYDNEINGTFAINIEKLDPQTAASIPLDSSKNYSVAAGEVKLYSFQIEQDSSYKITIEGSEFIGAYGNQVHVNVTALRENVNAPYFFEELALSPVYSGQPNKQYFTALATETVYLGIVGAYWWDPRDVIITLNRN